MNPQHDPTRGIYYAALTLSGCLVEYFGDQRIITISKQCICRVNITRPLKLLELRGVGAMNAGSVSALAKIPDRRISQQWSTYFYENEQIYSNIDGIIYSNAHNDEVAISLYERAINGLSCSANQIKPLDHPNLRPAIQKAASQNNLIFEP